MAPSAIKFENFPDIAKYATKCGSEYSLRQLLRNIRRIFIVYDRGAGEVGIVTTADVDLPDVLWHRGGIAMKR